MSPKTMPRVPSISIAFDREEIDVTSMGGEPTPDKDWRHIDTNGHMHAWVGNEIPTLEWVVTGTEWVGDEYDSSEIETGEYRCKACGDVVEAKTIRTFLPQTAYGLATITVSVNDEHFALTETAYTRAVEAWVEALRAQTR